MDRTRNTFQACLLLSSTLGRVLAQVTKGVALELNVHAWGVQGCWHTGEGVGEGVKDGRERTRVQQLLAEESLDRIRPAQHRDQG